MIGWLTRGQTVFYTIRRSAAPGSVYHGDMIMCRNVRRLKPAENPPTGESPCAVFEPSVHEVAGASRRMLDGLVARAVPAGERE